MASKKSTTGKSSKSSAKPNSKTAVSMTSVRNTAIPKAIAAPAAPAKLTYESIAQRAFEIWSSQGGDETSNWLRAEAELRNAA